MSAPDASNPSDTTRPASTDMAAHPPAAGKRPSRRAVLRAAGTAGAIGAAGMLAGGRAAARSGDRWRLVAEDVRRQYRTSWIHYRRRAFGADQIKPISGGSEDFFVPGHSVGLTVIESLDTLWLMELDSELDEALDWVRNNTQWDIDAEFGIFETNIRLVGGLAAGYHCTGERFLLDRALDLAQRLLPAFERSPTGLPYRRVNLATAAVRDARTNLAEIGTYIAEFGILSEWTGDRRFFDAAKAAMVAAYRRRSELDLVAFGLDTETGMPTTNTATIGPPADSFYEYLWDAYALFGDRELLGIYRRTRKAIAEHQSVHHNGRLWFARVDATTGTRVNSGQSELAAFYAGLLAESGEPEQAADYHDSWDAVQQRFGVLPGAIDYRDLSASYLGNALRPEFVDAALFLWLRTGDERYRQRAYRHYRAMLQTSQARYGFAALADVTTSPATQADSTPGYWWSEQMKYYWLMFGDSERFDYRSHYLSTEGNLLRGARH